VSQLSLTDQDDAVAIAAAVQEGEIHPREVIEAAIDRIEAANVDLSFLVFERYAEAMREAESVDRGAALAGVPVLVKDFLATCQGCRYTEGSRYLRDWVAPEDSAYVARLRRAGAVVVGIVSTPEMALKATCEPHRYGITRNPNAPGRTTGGSSGAGAAAVAAEAVPAAHGNDAGGSLRIPASCCGVIGLKPTRARNPLGPAFGDLGAGIWVEHVMTRSARDSAAFLDATHGPAPGDPYAAPPLAMTFADALGAPRRRLRIAVSDTTPRGEPVEGPCVTAVERTVAALEALGHHVFPGAPKFDIDAAEDAYFSLFCAGTAADVDYWTARLGRAPEEDELEPYTWGLVNRGRAVTAPQLLGALTCTQRAAREIAVFHSDVDLWLTPTLASLPVPLGHFEIGPGETADDVLDRDARFTPFAWIANITGQPAISYPAYATPEGIPVGVHFSGRFGDEATLLALVAELEPALPRQPE
jgi:amidase